MGRLSLIVADADEKYIEALVELLITEYSQRFKVSSFTKQDSLLHYITEQNKTEDILLINPELYNNMIPIEKFKTVILLSSGSINAIKVNKVNSKVKQNNRYLNKYQHIDRLVSNIMALYSECNQNEIVFTEGSKSTKVIGVFSPAGGSGNTSIAVYSSILFAEKGLAVFYLNLEGFNSTSTFFDCTNEKNLSNVYFYLRENSANLALKIEGARSIDPVNKIHYFSPPDSIFETEDVLPEEQMYLIEVLKSMKQYDIIIVDMGSVLDKMHKLIFNFCDEVFLVITQEPISQRKFRNFLKEWDFMLNSEELLNKDKLSVVVNKYIDGDMVLNEDSILTSVDGFNKIPYDLSVIENSFSKDLLNTNNNFSNALNEFLKKCLPKLIHDERLHNYGK